MTGDFGLFFKWNLLLEPYPIEVDGAQYFLKHDDSYGAVCGLYNGAC